MKLKIFFSIAILVFFASCQNKFYGNRKINNFSYAKRVLSKFYADNGFRTIYCDCAYKGKKIDFESCQYVPLDKKNRRSYNLEWEHIVPISYIGRNLKSWKRGDPRCLKENGKPFKGRSCANLVSKEFNRMEGDLYNLAPSVGEVNKLRSNFPIGLVEKKSAFPLHCKTKIIPKGMIEPRDEVKGFVARVYLYMDRAYPGNGIINESNREMIREWSKKYPPTEEEKKRNAFIKKKQESDF